MLTNGIWRPQTPFIRLRLVPTVHLISMWKMDSLSARKKTSNPTSGWCHPTAFLNCVLSQLVYSPLNSTGVRIVQFVRNNELWRGSIWSNGSSNVVGAYDGWLAIWQVDFSWCVSPTKRASVLDVMVPLVVAFTLRQQTLSHWIRKIYLIWEVGHKTCRV